jgi:hypothetical protein
MDDTHNHCNTMDLVEDRTQQIVKILESEDITYGMAKQIIQRVEAELLKSGDTFLSQAKFKKVSPLMFISHH